MADGCYACKQYPADLPARAHNIAGGVTPHQAFLVPSRSSLGLLPGAVEADVASSRPLPVQLSCEARSCGLWPHFDGLEMKQDTPRRMNTVPLEAVRSRRDTEGTNWSAVRSHLPTKVPEHLQAHS